jgi:L-methionine (R)-S-oxide reductase
MNADFSPMQDWLQTYVKDCGAVAGTVHLRQGDGLALAAAVNIPPPVQEIVRWVPWGKGMAGMALDTGEPVQTCNLKEDVSGRVKPGAKAVSAQAAIALPLKDADGAVTAVLGVAFQEEREIGQTEIDSLLASAQSIPTSPQVEA